MNGVKLTYQENSFIVNDNIYKFSDGFINFLTNPNVTYDDKIEEKENKIKRFLFDIKYDTGKSDKKSSRYGTIKSVLLGKDGVFGRGLNSICKAGSLIHIKPNNIVEKLELLILETKAGHDRFYNEMLNLSKQLLSMNIINKEQLHNFILNYG